MDHPVILRANVGGVEILYPLEMRFQCLPRIGESIDLREGLAIVEMVTHYTGNGFYYPGEIMRRNGVRSKWGITHYFRTVIYVKLINTHYTENTAEMWNFQQGWDFFEWINNADS